MYLYILEKTKTEMIGSKVTTKPMSWEKVVFPMLRDARRLAVTSIPRPSKESLNDAGWLVVRSVVTAWGKLVVYERKPLVVPVQLALDSDKPPVLIGGKNLDFSDTLSSGEVVEND